MSMTLWVKQSNKNKTKYIIIVILLITYNTTCIKMCMVLKLFQSFKSNTNFKPDGSTCFSSHLLTDWFISSVK